MGAVADQLRVLLWGAAEWAERDTPRHVSAAAQERSTT
jgi:hypothetical protein